MCAHQALRLCSCVETRMIFYLSLDLKFDLPEDLQSNVTITAYIGSSKKECDIQVENNSILGDGIPVLGHFVKFVACKTEILVAACLQKTNVSKMLFNF